MGQAHAQKFAWLPCVNIQFKTINDRLFVSNAKQFVHYFLIPTLEDVEVIENR